MKRILTNLSALFMCSLFITISACSVSYKFNQADIPVDAKTLSVGFFQNNAPLANPALSNDLTEGLKTFLSQQTGKPIINGLGDLHFEGAIVSYTSTPVALQSNDLAGAYRLTITVTVKYYNKLDEKKNFEATFSRYADYPGDQNLASIERDLVTKINQQLAEDIFNKAFNNW